MRAMALVVLTAAALVACDDQPATTIQDEVRPLALPSGAAVWAGALVVGMALRGLVFDRGTAPSFVIVTAIVLGLFLLGWRLAWTRLGARVSGAASS